MSHFVLFRGFVRLVESVEFRGLTSRRLSHLPFGRISRPSVTARIQCPCKANGGPGTAVNYPLYTALALELILNDPSNLAGEREGERGKKKDKRDASPGLVPRSAENSRDHEDRETMSATTTTKRTGLKTKRRHEMETKRIFPGIVFGIPTFPPHRLQKGLLPLCYSVSRRGQVRLRIACVLYPRRQMCQNCKCVRSDETHREAARRLDRNRARIP